jgi:uncharacterized protein YjbI with pentapeptide repeats
MNVRVWLSAGLLGLLAAGCDVWYCVGGLANEKDGLCGVGVDASSPSTSTSPGVEPGAGLDPYPPINPSAPTVGPVGPLDQSAVDTMCKQFQSIPRRKYVGDLSGANFRDRNLTWTDFSSTKLVNADFTNAILDCSDFSHAIMDGAIFTNAKMRKTTLDQVNGDKTYFMAADLSRASFIKAILPQVDMRGAILVNGVFRELQAERGFFSASEITGADFTGGIFTVGARFDHIAKGEGAIFDTAQLQEATFFESNLPKAIFKNAVASSVSFVGTQLQEADFTETDLKLANLTSANIVDAVTTGWVITGTTFCNTVIGTGTNVSSDNTDCKP